MRSVPNESTVQERLQRCVVCGRNADAVAQIVHGSHRLHRPAHSSARNSPARKHLEHAVRRGDVGLGARDVKGAVAAVQGWRRALRGAVNEVDAARRRPLPDLPRLVQFR